MKCPTCRSEGFEESVMGPKRCTFCDGTEGGSPPNDRDIMEYRWQEGEFNRCCSNYHNRPVVSCTDNHIAAYANLHNSSGARVFHVPLGDVFTPDAQEQADVDFFPVLHGQHPVVQRTRRRSRKASKYGTFCK